MGNLKINRKEDVELISAAICVERFCNLGFHRFICEQRGSEFDMEARVADMEKIVRTRVEANSNNKGELNLTGDDLIWATEAVGQVFRQYKRGSFSQLREQGGDIDRLCRFVRGNFKRLRQLEKNFRAHQEAMDAAAGSAHKRIQPSSIIVRDDVSIVVTCLRLEGYTRLLGEGRELGMFAVNSDNETDFRYLIDDNFDEEGNLHLSWKNDIMAVLDATEVAREILQRHGETFQEELQEIDRIADQLLRAIGAPCP